MALQTAEYLAEYGAEVIKVESRLRPDPLRTMPPFKDNKPGLERSLLFTKVVDNVYSMTLNLKQSERN